MSRQAASEINDSAKPLDSVPIGVSFDWDTVRRKGNRGDNWCMAWAADGNIYLMMDDGSGFSGDDVGWNARMIRIACGPGFVADDTWACTGWPYHPPSIKGKGFYGYATCAVGNRIYAWVWKSERNGYIIPPASPGLGVELNEEVMAAFPYNPKT